MRADIYFFNVRTEIITEKNFIRTEKNTVRTKIYDIVMTAHKYTLLIL